MVGVATSPEEQNETELDVGAKPAWHAGVMAERALELHCDEVEDDEEEVVTVAGTHVLPLKSWPLAAQAIIVLSCLVSKLQQKLEDVLSVEQVH